MTTQIKRIKLHGKRRAGGLQRKAVPWLSVNGLWLERAGFGVGQRVEIAIEKRKLTIIAL